MADEVKIDKALFGSRLNKIISAWKAKDEDDSNEALGALRSVDSMLILLGGQSDEINYQKTASLHVSRGAEGLTRQLYADMLHGTRTDLAAGLRVPLYNDAHHARRHYLCMQRQQG